MIGGVEEPLLSPSYFQLSLLMWNICCYEENDAQTGWNVFKEMQNLGLRRRKEEDYFIDPPEGKLVFLQPVYYTQDTCSVDGAYVTID